ncbi:MAG: hypothetical protein KDA28_16840 [Phycisphaerales bacterium]|nr:hypothetical protein [Phycisphaerales bacterium]
MDGNVLSMELVGLIGGLFLGALFIIFLICAVVLEERRKMAEVRHREETKREIAAYVAEGSISAADAQTIISGDKKSLGSVISSKLS